MEWKGKLAERIETCGPRAQISTNAISISELSANIKAIYMGLKTMGLAPCMDLPTCKKQGASAA